MQTEKSFNEATKLFYESKYHEGMELLNECLAKESKNSIIYCNRALFHFQLGQIEDALGDIDVSLRLNPLNYMAYFNLFSIELRNQNIVKAINSLLCSMSCLYLLRGRITRKYQDIDMSIEYCSNNMDAHVLKVLMLTKEEKYSQALESLEYAQSNFQQNNAVDKLKRKIMALSTDGEGQQQQTFSQILRSLYCKRQRLSSFYPQIYEENTDKLVIEKLEEFNKIYNSLNQVEGSKTYMIAKPEDQLGAISQSYDEKMKKKQNNELRTEIKV